VMYIPISPLFCAPVPITESKRVKLKDTGCHSNSFIINQNCP